MSIIKGLCYIAPVGTLLPDSTLGKLSKKFKTAGTVKNVIMYNNDSSYLSLYNTNNYCRILMGYDDWQPIKQLKVDNSKYYTWVIDTIPIDDKPRRLELYKAKVVTAIKLNMSTIELTLKMDNDKSGCAYAIYTLEPDEITVNDTEAEEMEEQRRGYV